MASSRILQELRLASRDTALRATLILLLLFTVLACVVGMMRQALRQQDERKFCTANESNRRVVESAFTESPDIEGAAGYSMNEVEKSKGENLRMSAKSPDLMSHLDSVWWACFRSSPLAILAAGSGQEWPNRYRIAAQSQAKTLKREMLTNPFYATTGPFDLSLFIATIVPLAIIVLHHDLLSEDRETGVIRLILSQPVSISRLLIIRCFIRTAAVVVVVVGLTGVVLLCTGTDLRHAEAAERFAVWSLLVFLHAACWSALALAINTLGFSSNSNAVFLLLLWVVCVLIIPKSAGRVARLDSSIRSPMELVALEAEAIEQAKKEAPALVAEFRKRNPGVIDGDDNPQREQLVSYLLVNETARGRFQHELRTTLDAFTTQDHRMNDWGWLSPAIAFRQGAAQLAGTSLSHYVEFARRTNRRQSDYLSYFRPMSLAERELTVEEVQAIPRFEELTLEREWDRRQVFASLAALLTWTVFFFVAGCLQLGFRPVSL